MSVARITEITASSERVFRTPSKRASRARLKRWRMSKGPGFRTRRSWSRTARSSRTEWTWRWRSYWRT